MGILRLLLALSVVFNHLPWNNGLVIVGGRVAVQLFYIISGFLIAYILNSTDRYKDVRKFYVSRWLRIYPIYYVVAAASLVTNLVGNPQFSALYASIPLDAALQLILSNLFIFGQDWTMFLGVSAGHLHAVADYRNSDVELFHGLLIPPAWTLGVELTFYLIAPFVLRSKRATFALLGLSILVRLVLMQLGLAGKDPWTYRFFPAELSLFLFGAISSQYLLPRWVKSTEAGPLRHAPAWAVSIIALVCLGYYYIPAEEWLKDSLLLTSFGILVPLTFIFQNRTPLDSVIGQLSYPVYIVHAPVIPVIRVLMRRWHVDDFTLSLLNVVAVLVCAIVLNKLVGEQVEHFRTKFKRRASAPETAANLSYARLGSKSYTQL